MQCNDLVMDCGGTPGNCYYHLVKWFLENAMGLFVGLLFILVVIAGLTVVIIAAVEMV
jgi:hypothetical protein